MVHPFATGSVRLSLAFDLFFSQAPIVIVIVVMIIVAVLVFVVAVLVFVITVFVFPRMKSLQSVRESLNVNLEPFQPLHQFWRALMIATSRTRPHLNHFAQLVQTGCV
jgi:uncharacterized membrane protein YesL